MKSAEDLDQNFVTRMFRHLRSEGLKAGDRLPSIRNLASRLEVSPTTVRDAVLRAQAMGLVKVHPRSGTFLQSLDYTPLLDVLAEALEPALLQANPNLFHLLEARSLIEVDLAGRAAVRRRMEDLLPLREALDGMARCRPRMEQPLKRPNNGDGHGDALTEFVEFDIRFHQEIAKIAGNSVLSIMLQALLGLLRPYLLDFHYECSRGNAPASQEVTDRTHRQVYDALMNQDPEAAQAAMGEHMRLAYDRLLADVQSPHVDGRAEGEDD